MRQVGVWRSWRRVYAQPMKKLGGAVLAAAAFALLVGCSSPTPVPTVTVTAEAAPAPTVTVTVTATPSAPTSTGSMPDVSTDAGICVADADMTNLELNDAIAPVLGYPADRDARTPEQDQAIRDFKNAAMQRMCPSRAG